MKLNLFHAPKEKPITLPSGVLELSNDVDPLEISLEGVKSIRLHFPKFTDGRAFSQAVMLRNRRSFEGDLCATGDVLIDQLLQGARVGFDAFEMRLDQNLEVGLKQFDLFTVSTQNSWRHKRTLLEA